MLLHITWSGLLNSNFMRSIGDIVVIIATNIKRTGIICAAINITEIAPMYNSELITLDIMLLASNKFLFIVLFFKKERKVPKERKNLFFISLMTRFVIQLNVLDLINVF